MQSAIAFRRRLTGPAPIVVRLGAVLAVPLVLYALYATGLKALDNYGLNRQATALRGEILSLRDENLQLQRDLEAARSDAAVEALAREELGLVMPGDKAIVLLPPSNALSRPLGSTATAASSAPAAPAIPPWRQWWDHFFGPGPR